MGMKIEESFDVQAPPDRVWAYLIDPRRVVTCLPGAELVEVEDERNFVGLLRVKVGPVSASYRGRARFEEMDAAARRVRMVAEGQESSGAGSAKMVMTSRVVALPDGGSRVEVSSEVDVLGRLVQFGRGMIEEVSRQMFGRFAACVRAQLEAESAAPPRADATGRARGGARPLRVLPLIASAIAARIRRLFRGSPTAGS